MRVRDYLEIRPHRDEEKGIFVHYRIVNGDTFYAEAVQGYKVVRNEDEPHVYYHRFEHEPIPGLHRSIIKQHSCRAVNIGSYKAPELIRLFGNLCNIDFWLETYCDLDDTIEVRYDLRPKSTSAHCNLYVAATKIIRPYVIIHEGENHRTDVDLDMEDYHHQIYKDLTTKEEALVEYERSEALKA